MFRLLKKLASRIPKADLTRSMAIVVCFPFKSTTKNLRLLRITLNGFSYGAVEPYRRE